MNQPEKVFRIGFISASVFVNEVGQDQRELRSVNLQRRYKDGNDWKSTSSFGLSDLPNAIRVLELARNHVEAHEAESSR